MEFWLVGHIKVNLTIMQNKLKMRNSKICLLIIVLGVLMMSIFLWQKKFSNHTKAIEVNIQTHIDPDLLKDLQIIINPNGYRVDGYSVEEYIGLNDSIYSLYPVTKIDKYNNAIASTSDYLIYAKYQDKYAVIRATNSIVVGDRNINLDIYAYIHDGYPVLTTDFGYKHQYEPLEKVLGDGTIKRYAFFYDKAAYKELNQKNELSVQNAPDENVAQVFKHHLMMIDKLDKLSF